MSTTNSDPRSRASYKRNVTITVIILIALIILGGVIGALSMLWGGPSATPPPENGLRDAIQIAAVLAGVLA